MYSSTGNPHEKRWEHWLGAFAFACAVGGAAIWWSAESLQVEKAYLVDCYNNQGKRIIHTIVKGYPSVYRQQYWTCIQSEVKP